VILLDIILLFVKEKSQSFYNFSDIVTVKLFESFLQFLYNNFIQVIVACIQCRGVRYIGAGHLR
jgi:hypothetical protein